MKQLTIYQIILLLLSAIINISCGTMSYLQTSVPEEGGVNFVKLTQDMDNVVGNKVYTMRSVITWWASPQIALSSDGTQIAYISEKNNTRNIMLKKTDKAGSSIQRTFRNNVMDLSWHPNGESIVFSESKNNRSSIYVIKAEEGSILQQLSNGPSDDFNPVYSLDGKLIYFSRKDTYGNSIWSYNTQNNLFTQYSLGYTPFPIKGEMCTLLCTRNSTNNRGEIWKINYETGVETLILSDNEKSFSTPQLSPDGKWILCMGSSLSNSYYQKKKQCG